jgi:DNA polymerase-3 subunit beta
VKISVETQELAEEVRRLAKITAEKGALPILSNVLLRADESGLLLAATDLQVGMVARCSAQVAEPGVITLPAKKLLELLDQLPSGSLAIAGDANHARLQMGGFRSRLPVLPADDFPMPPEPAEAGVALPAAALRQMIERTRYAISDKSAAHVLKGALLSIFSTGAFAMVATDGKRLSIATASCPTADPISLIIPTKTLDTLIGHCEGPAVVFQTDGKTLFFQAGQRMLYSQMLEAQFPAYERIIPRNTTICIGLDRGAIEAAMRRCGVVANEERAISVTMTPGACTVAAQSHMLGEAEEAVPAEYEGDPIRFAINGRYVLDFLEHAQQPQITIDAVNPGSPLLFTDGPDFINVILVMRT